MQYVCTDLSHSTCWLFRVQFMTVCNRPLKLIQLKLSLYNNFWITLPKQSVFFFVCANLVISNCPLIYKILWCSCNIRFHVFVCVCVGSKARLSSATRSSWHSVISTWKNWRNCSSPTPPLPPPTWQTAPPRTLPLPISTSRTCRRPSDVTDTPTHHTGRFVHSNSNNYNAVSSDVGDNQ